MWWYVAAYVAGFASAVFVCFPAIYYARELAVDDWENGYQADLRREQDLT